jgi:hypothetical protein
MKNVSEILQELLSEENLISPQEYSLLTEEAKTSTIREIAMRVLDIVRERIEVLDTTPVDRSSGDIKQVKDFSFLQEAIEKIEDLIDAAESRVTPELVNYLKQIERAILHLNSLAPQFKEAYRQKKTLLILKYQSLILSIFSSVSYLISVMLDFSEGEPKLIEKPEYQEIAPLKTIKEFNESVERGDFRDIFKSIQTMREYVNEVGEDKIIMESSDILPMIIGGIKTLYDNFVGDGNLTQLLYKISGIIALILSLREVIYSFFRARVKFSEIFDNIKSFVGGMGGNTGLFSKLQSFGNKFVVDAEESTNIARREISDENRDIAKTLRTVSSKPEPVAAAAAPSQDSGFDLGF